MKLLGGVVMEGHKLEQTLKVKLSLDTTEAVKKIQEITRMLEELPKLVEVHIEG